MNTTPGGISHATKAMWTRFSPYRIFGNAVPHFLGRCTPVGGYRPTLENAHPECREPPEEDIGAHKPECVVECSDVPEDPTQEHHQRGLDDWHRCGVQKLHSVENLVKFSSWSSAQASSKMAAHLPISKQ